MGGELEQRPGRHWHVDTYERGPPASARWHACDHGNGQLATRIARYHLAVWHHGYRCRKNGPLASSAGVVASATATSCLAPAATSFRCVRLSLVPLPGCGACVLKHDWYRYFEPILLLSAGITAAANGRSPSNKATRVHRPATSVVSQVLAMLGELAPAVVRNISRADPTQDHLAAARAAVAAVSACRSSARVLPAVLRRSRCFVPSRSSGAACCASGCVDRRLDGAPGG